MHLPLPPAFISAICVWFYSTHNWCNRRTVFHSRRVPAVAAVAQRPSWPCPISRRCWATFRWGFDQIGLIWFVRLFVSFRFVSFVLCRFSHIAFRIFRSLLVVHYFIHSFEIAFDFVSFSRFSFCPRTFSLNYFSWWARQAATSRSLHISQCVILIVIVTWACCTCVCVISALYWVWVLGVYVGLFEDHANCQSCAYKFVDGAYLSSARDWIQRGYPQASQLKLQWFNLQEKCLQIQLGLPMKQPCRLFSFIFCVLSNFSIKMKYFFFSSFNHTWSQFNHIFD